MQRTLLAVMFAAVAGGLTVCAQDSVNDASSAAPATPYTLDSSPLDRSATHQFTSYAPMLERVTPAVVTVATSSVVRVMRNQSDPMQELLRRFYGLPMPEQRQQGGKAPAEEERRVPNGLGSGVIISANGYIVTNNHVVSDQSGAAADEISITLADGREFAAKLVGRDPQTDLALLKIEAEGLPIIPMADSDQLKVGDIVFAVGNPMGLSKTVTMGIVSALGRSRLGILGDRGYEDFIQTDASINPGNSGGALVDAQGRLVGINTAILSRSGGSIGIGFAIPSSMARSIVSSLVDSGRVERGFLGVTIRSMDAALAESFGIANGKGSLVEGVQEGSPAEKAGIKRGDVIVSVDGKAVSDDAELRIHVSQKRPGSVVRLGFMRDGALQSLDVTLGSLGGEAQASDGDKLFEGVSLRDLNDELAREYGLGSAKGVVVTKVAADSPFARVMAPGMQILEVNDKSVESVADVARLLRKGAVNRLWIAFRGQARYVAVRIP